MTNLTRRSVLRSSIAVAGAGALTRPHIANAAATTAEQAVDKAFKRVEEIFAKYPIAQS